MGGKKFIINYVEKVYVLFPSLMTLLSNPIAQSRGHEVTSVDLLLRKVAHQHLLLRAAKKAEAQHVERPGSTLFVTYIHDEASLKLRSWFDTNVLPGVCYSGGGKFSIIFCGLLFTCLQCEPPPPQKMKLSKGQHTHTQFCLVILQSPSGAQQLHRGRISKTQINVVRLKYGKLLMDWPAEIQSMRQKNGATIAECMLIAEFPNKVCSDIVLDFVCF